MCPICNLQEAFEYRLTDTSGVARFIWHGRYVSSGSYTKQELSCPLRHVSGPEILTIDQAMRLEARALPNDGYLALQALKTLGADGDQLNQAVKEIAEAAFAQVKSPVTKPAYSHFPE